MASWIEAQAWYFVLNKGGGKRGCEPAWAAFTSTTFVRQLVWVLSSLALAGSHRRMASQVIHIMTPFGAIRTVMKSCCLATFHTDSDKSKQRVTCQGETVDSSNTSGAVSVIVWTVKCVDHTSWLLWPVLFLSGLFKIRSVSVLHLQYAFMCWSFIRCYICLLFFWLLLCSALCNTPVVSQQPPPVFPPTSQTLHACFVTGQINLD